VAVECTGIFAKLFFAPIDKLLLGEDALWGPRGPHGLSGLSMLRGLIELSELNELSELRRLRGLSELRGAVRWRMLLLLLLRGI
jgi:hypothetical protein